jgi:hypothetical protein
MKKRLADCAVWQQWGFYLVLAMSATAYLSTGAVSVGIAASSLVFLGQRYFTGKWPYVDKKIASVIGIYIAVNYLIAALSIAPSVSLRQVGSDVYRFFPFFFAAAYVRTRKQLWQVLLAFGISVFVNNLVALSQFFGGLQNADVQAGKTWMHIHGLISSSTFFLQLAFAVFASFMSWLYTARVSSLWAFLFCRIVCFFMYSAHTLPFPRRLGRVCRDAFYCVFHGCASAQSVPKNRSGCCLRVCRACDYRLPIIYVAVIFYCGYNKK